MNTDEKKKLYAALAAPFPESAIERTDGRVTGRGYDTTGIKYQYVVNRLNEVLGIGGYRVERAVKVREITTAKGRPAFDATCEVKVTLGEWSGGEFMPFAEAIGDGGHTSTSEADAIKGAFTNGFKKTVAFFGVGKQAYEGTLDDDNVPGELATPVQQHEAPRSASLPRTSAPPQQQAPSTRSAQTEQPPAPQTQQRNRLTQKQLNALLAISRKRGWDDKAFRDHVRERYGTTLDYLTRAQASEMIDMLSAGNGHDRQPGQEG